MLRSVQWKIALVLALCTSLLAPLVASADGGSAQISGVSASSAATSSSQIPAAPDRLPLLYAVALTGPFNLSGAPGATLTPINAEFLNYGLITWQSAYKIQLHSSATGSFFGLGSGPGSCDPTKPLRACTWTITYTLSSTAPPGTITDHLQMYIGSRPFGQIITVTITVT